MTQAAPVTRARPASPGGAAPKRVVPAIATLLVRSDTVAGKDKPLLTGLVVLFRTTTMSPIPVKAKSKTAAKDEPEAPVAEPRPFSAGMVDRRGYVVPWEQGRLERGQRKPVTTDSIKFVGPPSEDATYDFFLVSHPDPQRIQAILDNVNENGGVFKDADGAETKPLPMKLGKNKGKGNEHVLEVAEDPTKLLPLEGADEYGGWLLYRDMPFQRCAGVSKQIEKLQKALGAMRYPIGSGDDPYFPDGEEKTGNKGKFDVRTWNGVLALQRALLANRDPLVKTDSVMALFDCATSKAFAEIAFAEKVTGTAAVETVPKPQAADGVVDRRTAAALKHCVANGLRKPRFVLQPIPHQMSVKDHVSSHRWMRAEAVAAVTAWRKLAETFGWSEGVHAFHTYRTCLADVTSADYGRASLSIHKSGYAVDLQMSGFIVPWSPNIFYEQVLREARVRWRLWAKIPADAAKLVAGFDEVAKLLGQRLGKDRADASVAEQYRASLNAANHVQASVVLGGIVGADLKDTYDRLLATDVKLLLKNDVPAFGYRRDHSSFGNDHSSFFVTKHAGDGHVFLCLTALARLVRLAGISAFTDGWHSTRKSTSLPGAVTLPPASGSPFASIASWLATAHKRYDEDLIAARSKALLAEIVSVVMGYEAHEMGVREKGKFIADANVESLVADLHKGVFDRHLRPLLGSDVESSGTESARALRAEISDILHPFAQRAIRCWATALEEAPRSARKVAMAEIEKIMPAYRAEIDRALDDFEARQSLGSEKLWHVKITRDTEVIEVPLKMVSADVIASMAAWKKGWADSLVASPSVVLTDVKAKVNTKDHSVTIDASQPRMKALVKVQGAIGDTALEIKAVFFAQGAEKGAKTKVPVAGNVVAKVDVPKGGDVVDAVRKVLEKAYADPAAVKFVPAVVVTPHFSVVDIREGDLVEVTYPGEPIGMEWWHFQYHPALQGEEEDAEPGAPGASQPKLWSTLLTEIGWELDVLGDQTIAGAYGYPGVGYVAKDLAKVAR